MQKLTSRQSDWMRERSTMRRLTMAEVVEALQAATWVVGGGLRVLALKSLGSVSSAGSAL